MYTVISGKLEVIDYPTRLNGDERRISGRIHKVINHMTSGDIVGEMGFLRGMPRSATVKVSEDGELLRVSWKMIHRLQWLYPLTAHRFFLNVMGIVCDRLENLTHRVSDECFLDDLTGLSNQKGFCEFLEKLSQYARRYGDELVLCLIGLSVNTDAQKDPGASPDDDEMARLVRQFCGILEGEIRECDTLSRIDAQTFGLLLTRATCENALEVCRRLEVCVQQKRLNANGNPLAIKFAVESFDPHNGESGLDLFSRTMSRFQAG
jgi:GGDEF domain-containing protein